MWVMGVKKKDLKPSLPAFFSDLFLDNMVKAFN